VYSPCTDIGAYGTHFWSWCTDRRRIGKSYMWLPQSITELLSTERSYCCRATLLKKAIQWRYQFCWTVSTGCETTADLFDILCYIIVRRKDLSYQWKTFIFLNWIQVIYKLLESEHYWWNFDKEFQVASFILIYNLKFFDAFKRFQPAEIS